jgi:mRNA-degrading endonuclease RelE of RelBE toxin-antitoxin system
LIEHYNQFAKGAHCEVWMHVKALKEYKSAPAKDRARIERILDHLSEQGPDMLNQEQFKQEMRHQNVVVFAAKSYQLRVYGGWKNGDPRLFLCPEIAIKKDNKADKDQLKRVAIKVGEI